MWRIMGCLEISQARPMVLIGGGEFCLHRAILVITTGGGVGPTGIWYLLSGDQGCCWEQPTVPEPIPQQRITQPKMSIVSRLRNQGQN